MTRREKIDMFYRVLGVVCLLAAYVTAVVAFLTPETFSSSGAATIFWLILVVGGIILLGIGDLIENTEKLQE